MSAATMNGHPPGQLPNGGGQPNDIEQTLNQLLTEEPFPINTLEKVVHLMYNGSPQERQIAQKILVQFEEAEASFSKVDSILVKAKNQETQFIALKTLEYTIDRRWKVLPRAQCEGVKNFIVETIIEITKDASRMAKEKVYLSKLNLILVKIISHDWPHHWPTALADIVNAAKSGESICQNNLEILRLLSEEIFEFSEDQMVQNKIKHLKESMEAEFNNVFELCYFVMGNSENEALVSTCLKTLLKFTNWIKHEYFFETDLIEKLTTRLLPHPPFRNASIACLTEIAGLENTPEKYQPKFVKLYADAFKVIQQIIPVETVNISQAYKQGSDNEQKLVSNLSMFFATVFTNHQQPLMNDCVEQLLQGLVFLVKISEVDDVEVFKICLDFWHNFCNKLYQQMPMNVQVQGFNSWSGPGGAGNNGVNAVFGKVLSQVRVMMIKKMAKPEDVLVVENENGEVVREVIKDTDSDMIYQMCKKTLVFLTHLDSEDMENIMKDKLDKQVDGSEWSFQNLNSLCWSVGSISGSMSEDNERRFLVNVIKELLGLCEQKRGKDNKAIIASCIMYVVGQYPRFLRQHWKFLKTVVNKLFEFMHETHDGVQDMACDTFLKIARKCRRQFVTTQQSEPYPFVEEIINQSVTIISDLQPHQVQVFYEAVGSMISCGSSSDNYQQTLIQKYMTLPNQVWRSLINGASGNVREFLCKQDTTRQLAMILKTNAKACTSIGHAYVYQLNEIFLDLMQIYTVMSEAICDSIRNNPQNISQPEIKEMRSIKKESLRLITLWITKSTDNRLLKEDYSPSLLQNILPDYLNSPVEVREPEVIDCCRAILTKLGMDGQDYVLEIFKSVFDPTLNMIKTTDHLFPEHRTNFFQLLSAINQHCFISMLKLNETQFRMVLDAIIWGMKQMMPECKETSLEILDTLLDNVTDPEITPRDMAQAFYKSYHIFILEHIFGVSTNILHSKANLSQHACLLMKMIHIVIGSDPRNNNQPIIQVSLMENMPDNRAAVYQHIANLLKQQFGNAVTDAQIQVFVEGIFTLYTNRADFISHLRDFLIQMKQMRGEDTTDLFLEERMAEIKGKQEENRKQEAAKNAAIPGMMNPYAALDDDEALQ